MQSRQATRRWDELKAESLKYETDFRLQGETALLQSKLYTLLGIVNDLIINHVIWTLLRYALLNMLRKEKDGIAVILGDELRMNYI